MGDFDKIVDDIFQTARDTIGPRLKDGACVFCGEDVPKGEYCTCLKADKINSRAKKINKKSTDLLNYFNTKGEQRAYLFSVSGVPRRFKGIDFDDYKTENKAQQKVKADVEFYFSNCVKNWILGTPMTLTGKFGTGKTMLTCILANRLINDWFWNVRFINFQEFIEKARSSFDNDSKKSLTDTISGYKNCDFLIFDDLDKIKPTEFVQDLFYNVIDYRYTRELPTIITANSSLEELEQIYYKEAAISRLFQDSVKIRFEHDNWRLTH